MKVALVTIAIGEKFIRDFKLTFQSTHEEYAKKCGYDFRLITEFLDPTFPNIEAVTFNKFLVCSQPWSNAYDFIIVVDADILINLNSPPLHSEYDYGDKIGMVDEYSQPTPAMRIEIQRFLNYEDSATDYYLLHAQQHIITTKVLNAGLMVLQPSKHREFLEQFYNKYSRHVIGHKSRTHFEQASIGYEIQTSNLCKIIDNKWNAILAIESIAENISLDDYIQKNYFIHFAGGLQHIFFPTNNLSTDSPRVLLVCIAIGDKYLQHYNTIFRPSHEAYAKKCGYDFKVVTDYLDPSFPSKEAVTFNKILVCSQPWSADYDYIIVIDADILINPYSPSLHSAYTYGDKIGIVDEATQPTPAMNIEINRINGTEETATEYYMLHTKKYIQTDHILNTGLMVFQPKLHKSLLEQIYNKYSRGVLTSKSGYHYEQAWVGYDIQMANMYKIIDNTWNAIWCLQSVVGEISLNDYVNQNYLTHFVGGMFHEYILHLEFYKK